MTVVDYPCDTCGYEGPHPAVWDEELGRYVAECGNTECAREFGVPAEEVTAP